MTLRTKHTPLPLQLLGAAFLTAFAFGVGPLVGFVGGDDEWTSLASPEAHAAPAAAPPVFWASVPPSPPPLPVPPELAELEAPDEPAPAVAPAATERGTASTASMLSTPSMAIARPRGPTLTTTNPAAAVTSSSSKGRTKRSRGCDPDPNPAIEKTGSGAWTVQRDLVQSYARSIKKLNSLGWSTPHEGSDGRNDGMLIGGVRCGSDLHLAGLRSGDVVHKVNGRSVKSFPQALIVYTKVKGDDLIEVQLTRRGKPTSLRYRLEG